MSQGSAAIDVATSIRAGTWARLGAPGRGVLTGGLAVVGLTLAGGQLRAWSLTGFGLVILLAGFAAAFAAAAPPAWRLRPGSPWPGVELTGGIVAATLGGLHLLEVAADLAAGSRGVSPTTLALAAALAALSVALLAACLARAPDLRLRGAARLALVGAAVCVVAVALGVTLGDRSVGQLTALTLGAAIGMVVAVGATRGRAGGAVALVLALVAALVSWALAGAIDRGNFGPVDRAFFLAHLAGLALAVLAGAATAIGRSRGPRHVGAVTTR